jgi:phosphatidylglycerophosphate synthase
MRSSAYRDGHVCAVDALARRALAACAFGAVLVVGLSSAARAALALQLTVVVAALAAFALIVGTALRYVRAYHPHARLGLANVITGFRAVLTALTIGALVDRPTPLLAWVVVGLATLALSIDGLDGWAARRQRLASTFGARFDMEVDALLILALSALVWRFEKAGAWVLASGAMRYAFIAAGSVWPWFERPLPPSRRRQAVCAVQIAGLIGALLPVVPRPSSALLAGLSLATLTWSFAVDVAWLVARRGHASKAASRP